VEKYPNPLVAGESIYLSEYLTQVNLHCILRTVEDKIHTLLGGWMP